MRIHTKANWSAREDRKAAVVWLAMFWIYVGFGFGFDLKNYFHESPPVPMVVHVHAVVATLWMLIATAMVLLVEFNNVKLHRTLGWFAAGYAGLFVVLSPWAEVSWQALNLHKAGSLPPEFLSIAFSDVVCLVVLLTYGVLLRGNTAAHRRLMTLAIICISSAGFSRLMSDILPFPTSWVGTYLFFYGGNLSIMLLMFLWDWYKGRVMAQFLQGAALIVAVDVVSMFLFFNGAWQGFTRNWLTWVAGH